MLCFTGVVGTLREARRALKNGGFTFLVPGNHDQLLCGILCVADSLIDAVGEDMGYETHTFPLGIMGKYEANVRLMENVGFVKVKVENITVLSDSNMVEAENWWG